jgi:ATP synthase I subunit
MATTDLTSSVTWAGACTVAVMSGGAWWVGGAPVAAGVAGGGAIALVNFRWLSRDIGRAVSLVIEGRGSLARFGRIGLRQFFTFGGLGLLIANGWVHPAAVGLGLAALPPVLFVQGLLHARKD